MANNVAIMSLYRKYRPKDFPSLIGQEHIKVTLLNSIKSGKIAHAYLFTGPRGTGKTTTARLLAKAINVDTMTEDGRFDDSELAEEIDAGRLIDVIEIDAASNRGIDEIRDLREKINYSPTRAKNKVYIIDEVHMLTKEAFNALLKTLEEPPSFVYFILATTEINKVPETIISRCQRFDFRRITEEILVEHLKQVAKIEGIEAEDEAVRILAKHARGGARDALTLLEQIATGKKLDAARVKSVLGISHYSACEEILEMMQNGQTADAMLKLDQIFQAGVDLVQFNRDFLDFLRQRLLEAVKQESGANTARFIELIGYFQEAYEKQKFSYIPELPLEVAIAKSGVRNMPNQDEQARPTPRPTQITQIKKPDTKTQDPELAEPYSGPEPSELSEDTKNTPELKDFLKKWNKVIERIHLPLAKRCLMAAKPVSLENGNLTLAFSNHFNKDKLFVPELLAVSEKAILEETGQPIKLTGKVDPGLVKDNTTSSGLGETAEESSDKAAESLPAEKSSVKNNVIESALNVFGGEMVA